MDEVVVESLPALRVAAVRHVGPYAGINVAFDRLHAIVTSARLPTLGLVGLFHDDPARTPPDALRSDAGGATGVRQQHE